MRLYTVLFALLALSGALAAQEGAGRLLETVQARETLLGSIVGSWQLYAIMIMVLMVGVVALAYAIATAFSLPDLKAWADVELGEIFASALILIFLIAIITFIDVAVRGLVAPAFPDACEGSSFCAASIAEAYLDSYVEAADSLYKDIMVKNIEKAREATRGETIGAQDLIYGYLTVRFRAHPEEMVIVEMYDQLLQNTGAIIAALVGQGFVLKFLTLRLAPLAVFLGIILRSFFLTRKLGGLLLAFGLGFLIVYPLMYALAWFTLDATIYGGQKAQAGPVSPCPEVCMPFSKVVEYTAGRPTGEIEQDELYSILYSECIDSLEYDETGRSLDCMSDCTSSYTPACRQRCADYCTAHGAEPPPEIGGTAEEIAAWEECTLPCEERENCDASEEEREAYCRDRVCPVVLDPEEHCEAEARERLLGLANGTITVGECPGTGCRSFGYCEYTECGFPVPYHKRECLLYQGSPNICNTRPFEPEDPAYSQFDESELYGCPEECRTLAPMKSVSEETGVCYNYYCKETRTRAELEEMCDERYGYLTCIQEPFWSNFVDENICKEYEAKCPSQCMWITTSGKTDPSCPETCNEFYPENPQLLWDEERNQDTCVYIIPDVVFENPELCSECAFVAEKGLTMKPQMILECADLCGAPTNVMLAEDPATMTNKVGGMVGPSELISVSKLMVPAYVLPLFSLAVTLMFITSLSPMLGGDIDIPGMLKLIQ